MSIEEAKIVKRALWFANEASIDLKGVYDKLGVFPPGAKLTVDFDKSGWHVTFRNVPRKSTRAQLRKSTYELRDWMREQLKKVVNENAKTATCRPAKGNKSVKLDFGAVTVKAGEALYKVPKGQTKMPMEFFVVHTTALLTDPDGPWRKWLMECLECGKVFYRQPTGGSRPKLCSDACRKKRNANRVRSFRRGQSNKS